MALFGTKYDDGKLCEVAELALVEDAVINNTGLEAISEKGVVTLLGEVRSELEKERAAREVEHAFTQAGLKYARIDNQIRLVGSSVTTR